MGVAPTEPGIPESASTPTQPRSTAVATSSSQSSPAATVTITPPHEAPSAPSGRTPRVATSTTTPSNPSSATTTLLPPPSTSTGSPDRSASSTAATTSASVVAVTQRRAGPPSRRVVRSRRSGTDDGLGHAEHLLPVARHLERQRHQSVAGGLHGAGDHHRGATRGGHHDRVGELAAQVDHLGAAGPVGDGTGRQRQGVHAVGDDAR